MSEISLRNSENDKAGQRPPNDEVSSAAVSKEGQKGQKATSLKKNSLVTLGLRSGDYSTQFDEEENGLEDDEYKANTAGDDEDCDNDDHGGDVLETDPIEEPVSEESVESEDEKSLEREANINMCD